MIRRLPGSEYPDVAESLGNLAVVLRAQARFGEMEAAVRECLVIRQKQAPDKWPTFDARRLLREALESLVELYEATARPEKAAEYKRRLAGWNETPLQ